MVGELMQAATLRPKEVEVEGEGRGELLLKGGGQTPQLDGRGRRAEMRGKILDPRMILEHVALEGALRGVGGLAALHLEGEGR